MSSDWKLLGFIPSTDIQKSKVFYLETLGLSLLREDDFALELRSGESQIRINKVDHTPQNAYTVLGWSVSDIDSTTYQLSKQGVKFERYEGLNQNEMGICRFPNGSRVAWFKDPDSNTLSITQFS